MTIPFLFANNAATTLAGAITNVATAATLAAGTGAEFPNPAAGEQFALTFTDAATGIVNEIVYVTARVGDVITMLRGQEGTAALAWNAGDNADALVTAGTLASMLQKISARIRMLVPMTFYVATTGSDVAGDGSNGNPWRTMQYAISVVQNQYDLNGQTVTFFRKAGAYTDPVNVYGPFVGQINGPGQVVLDGASMGTVSVTVAGPTYDVRYGAQVTVQNQRLVCTGGAGFTLTSNTFSSLLYQNIDFGPSTGFHIGGSYSSNMVCVGPCTISGSASQHANVGNGATLSIQNVVTTLTGTPAFSAGFIQASQGGTVSDVTGSSFVGAATGPRYEVLYNGVIYTNSAGATHYPGNSAGVVTTGGQYN